MSVRLRMTGVQKSFGATRALRNVSLEVAPGEVHALIGENGAGKSTLMKVLSGACLPDAGQIVLDGQAFVPATPLHARRCGIEMIYQELTLAPHLSVEENILLGEEPSRLGWLNRKKRSELARAALGKLNHQNIPLDALAGALPLAEQQIVEIARALVREPKLLIMDEPTSSLTKLDAENLFGVIGRLSERGVSVVYISHFLEECKRICEGYTVLRDGETVATGKMGPAALKEIIHLMVGRELEEIYPRIPHAIGKPVLELRNFAGVKKPRAVDLLLREGEILGIAGLLGTGRTETLRACFGLDDVKRGNVLVWGKEATAATARQRLDAGMGLLSENRKEEGLLLNRNLADNLTITRFGPLGRCGFISNRLQHEATDHWIAKLGVRAENPLQRIGDLSGGNQQKLAIGRLLHHQAKILLLDEPTR
ncbi:MAG TPA: sugar ABC transporter ATP-binding protein, partial [Candidatus Saccharimonadales bacterium]|nr:sugar ABC transporter ATP-binding protein [Candidatus Saccharimonadales bacterium]